MNHGRKIYNRSLPNRYINIVYNVCLGGIPLMILTKAKIDKLAARRGVRSNIVSSFLSTMSDNKQEMLTKLENLKYNLATLHAISDGIRMRFDE